MPCSACGDAGAAEAAFRIPAPQTLPDKVAVGVEAFLNHLQSMYDKRIITSEQWSLMQQLAVRHVKIDATMRS